MGLLGILLFMSLESYRTYLITLERNLTIIDFDKTAELIEKEFLFIKKTLIIEPKDSRSFSLSLDTSSEWREVVRSKVDLSTNNVATLFVLKSTLDLTTSLHSEEVSKLRLKDLESLGSMIKVFLIKRNSFSINSAVLSKSIIVKFLSKVIR